MNADQQPRRWYQFSLRTMFVGMTLACAILSWVGYLLNWMNERQEIRRWRSYKLHLNLNIHGKDDLKLPVAPGGMWILGEEGVAEIFVYRWSPGEVPRIKKLFPEAVVHAPEHAR